MRFSDTARYPASTPVIVLILASILVYGCAPPRKTVSPHATQANVQPAAPERGGATDIRPDPQQEVVTLTNRPGDPNLLLPVMTMVNDRIYAYEQKLAEWDAFSATARGLKMEQEQRDRLGSCRQQLQDVLVEYNALHQRLLEKEQLEAALLLAGDSLLPVSGKDIAFLESGCPTLLVEPVQPPGVVGIGGGSLHGQEASLRAAADQGEHGRVIDLYRELPLEPGQKASFESTYLYGQALLRTGRESESRSVFTQLLEDIRSQDQAQWEFRLLQLIGDLEFGLELYDSARAKYGDITKAYEGLGEQHRWAEQQLAALDVAGTQRDEVRAYADLLMGYLTYNPERDGYAVVESGEAFIAKYPYSPVASNADQLILRARRDAEKWLEGVLNRIDALEAEQRFQEAILLVERVPPGILPLDKQEMLRRKAEELTTAESITIETQRLVEEQTLQENWNTAMTRLEAKEYDLAIEGFAEMLGTSYEVRARERIQEASELAASEDRRRAAELFVRASRSPDLETKKKLLFASRQLLQDILVKYPQSGLIDKVNRNLSRIEEEISALDPTLLMTPATLGGSDAQGAGGAGVPNVNGAGATSF